MINAAEVSNYSGSGSGLPLLIQRSVARQISLINVIGKIQMIIITIDYIDDELLFAKICDTNLTINCFRKREVWRSLAR